MLLRSWSSPAPDIWFVYHEEIIGTDWESHIVRWFSNGWLSEQATVALCSHIFHYFPLFSHVIALMEGAHFWAGHVSLFESRWSFSQRRAQCALSLNKGFLKYHLAIKRDDGKSIVDDLPMLARIDIYIYTYIYEWYFQLSPNSPPGPWHRLWLRYIVDTSTSLGWAEQEGCNVPYWAFCYQETGGLLVIYQ